MRWWGAVGVVVLMGACTASAPTPPKSGSLSLAPASQPSISSLDDDCSGLGRAEREISFVSHHRLYVARPGATAARCVVTASEGTDLRWGPQADRAFLLTSAGGRMMLDGVDRSDHLPYSPQAIPQGWSRPRGLAFLWITPDHRSLLKIDAGTGAREDVTFLARTDEAIYHPAGENILAVGEAEDGTYGIFLATNEGTEVQPLVIGESAKRIYSLSFGPSGTLFYAAEHPDRFDAHRISFTKARDTGTVDATLQTVFSTTDEITRVVSSPFRETDVAVQTGTCDTTTVVANGVIDGLVGRSERRDQHLVENTHSLGAPLDEMSTEPVGWLSTHHLLVRARPSGCHGPASLYLWTPQRGAQLLVDHVGTAAVRVAYPDPPPPPAEETEVVA
ncbi:MAG TPA: hypothetical protein VFK89_11050 [Actinomycetota bacterium]|nr:hypothetical protein [Actinomycetota bacterium]